MNGQPGSHANGQVHGIDRPRVVAEAEIADAVDAALDDAGQIRRRGEHRTIMGMQARVDAAGERDRAADARDLQALQRDERADARDRSDLARLLALAADDRAAAAADRAHAARDRARARSDREALIGLLAVAETDALTGARTRAAGLRDLDVEITRARRADTALVVAYVDVVGLKHVNDSEGHLAGDALLQRVVTQIRALLRPYDLIIRLGGDEFLCAMSNTAQAEARERFSEIASALAGTPQHTAIRAGFSELTGGDCAGDLISRADRELLEHHHHNGGRRANRRNGER